MEKIGINNGKPFPMGKVKGWWGLVICCFRRRQDLRNRECVWVTVKCDRGNSPESPNLPSFKISDLDLRWEVGGGPTVSGTSSSLTKPYEGLHSPFGWTSFCKSCQPVASESSSAFYSNWCFKLVCCQAVPAGALVGLQLWMGTHFWEQANLTSEEVREWNRWALWNPFM